MKIVLPVHHFPPRYTAGAELITLRLARWLQSQGHAVEVVCVERIDANSDQQLAVEQDEYQGITVWRLSFNLQQAPNHFLWEYDNPLIGGWFSKYLADAQPTLVHFQSGYLLTTSVLESASAHSIPTVLSLHDYWYLCPRITLLRGDGSLCQAIPADPAECAWCMKLESRRYRLPDRVTGGLVGKIALAQGMDLERQTMIARRARVREVLQLIDCVIVPSRFMVRHFAPLIDAERLHVSRYGLDIEQFQERPERSRDGVLRIGFIGQIVPHKGVHLLIEAFRSLQMRGHTAEIHIYGGLDANPRYVSRLRRLAGDDSRIHFQGRFENGRVGTILAGLDVTVVPSTWYEVGPLTIMESQAAGTPVIASALGNMAEIVHDGVDGLHFRPSDAEDLARQLQRLIDEPNLLDRLRAGIVMPRSTDDEMKQLMDIYQKALAQPRATHPEAVLP